MPACARETQPEVEGTLHERMLLLGQQPPHEPLTTDSPALRAPPQLLLGMAQLGKFVAGDVSDSESESTYQKNYVY